MVDCPIRPIRCLMPMRAILRKACSASNLTYTRRSAILRPCIHRHHQVVLGKHRGNPAEQAVKHFPYKDPWGTMHQCIINYLRHSMLAFSFMGSTRYRDKAQMENIGTALIGGCISLYLTNNELNTCFDKCSGASAIAKMIRSHRFWPRSKATGK